MTAKAGINVNVGPLLADGVSYGSTINSGSLPDLAAVVADTATLVADGATPTQGHVNTLNTHVTALNAAIAGDVSVTWNPATVTTGNQLRSALRTVLKAADGGYGGLT